MVARIPVPVPLVTVPSNGASVVLTLDEAVALGHVPGARNLHVGGRRTAVDTETELWTGAAGFVTRTDTAGLVTVDSSGNDTALGTGANTVAIGYLDAFGHYRFAVASLTGAAGAPAVAAQASGVGNKTSVTVIGGQVSATRILHASVVSANGGGAWTAANENAITIKIGGVAAGVIPAGDNEMKASSLSVPQGYTGILTGLGYASDDELHGVLTIYVRALGVPRQRRSRFEVARGAAAAPISKPIRVGPRADVVLTATKSLGGTTINVSTLMQVTILPEPIDGFADKNPELQPPEFG